MNSTPPTESQKRTGRIMATLVGVGAIIGGVLIGYYQFVQPLKLMQAAQQWNGTSCEITGSSVATYVNANASQQRDRRPTYSANIAYRYTVQSKAYTGSRDHFTTLSSADRGDAETTVRRYPVGTTTGCWYDPANPSESVLDRTPNSDLWFGLFPGGLLVVGVGMILFAAFGNWDKVRIRESGILSSGSSPFGAQPGIQDVDGLVAAQLAARYQGLARAASGIIPRGVVIVIVVIVVFVASVMFF